MALLEVTDLHVYFGNIEALKGISLEADPGQIVAILGSNGAGKTTTLRAVSGLLRPRSGSIKCGGKSLVGVFKLFPRLAERQAQLAGTLSGGEQQMLAIGRALMSDPKVLMLDEPSLGLAPILARSVLRTVREIAARGTAVLLVEQNARQALAIADKAYVIEVGRVVLQGEAATLARDERVQRAYLGGFEAVGNG